MVVAGLFALPAAASGAPFGELPFRAVGGAASCLRAGGVPGELVRWTRGGVEVATVGGGVTPVALGDARECPVVVSAANGFTAVAAATEKGVAIAVRDPGGAWTAPVTVATKRARGVQVAVSARGDVLAAWLGQPKPGSTESPVYAVRRTPGAAFGARERLGGPYSAPELGAGLSGDGGAVVAVADREELLLATAAPGAAFGAPRRVTGTRSYNGGLALAVGADGRALLAADTGRGVAVFDREPGGTDFLRRPVVPLSSGGTPGLAVAFDPDGGALLAAEGAGRIQLVRRSAGGAFGQPESVLQTERNQDRGGALLSVAFADGGPPYETRSPLRALLGAGGRALVTWSADDLTTYATTLDPGATPVTARVGGPLRDPQGLTPLLLADGTRAIAWTDNNGMPLGSPFAGRVHIAVEGAAAASPAPAPDLEVGAPADRSLRPAQSLSLPVRCSAACDVRVETPERVFDPGTTRSTPGAVRLRVYPWDKPIAPARPGPVELALVWSAPGSSAVARRTVRVRLRRAPAPRFPRLRDVRATRGPGGVVDVRWSTDVRVVDAGFRVVGDVRRAERELDDGVSSGGMQGGGKRRFHVRLTGAARVRYVRIEAYQYFGPRHRRTTVAVR